MIDGLMKRVHKMIDDAEATADPLSNRFTREMARTLADCKRQRIAGPEIAKLQKIYDERGAKKEE
jgi:hypothetical protein